MARWDYYIWNRLYRRWLKLNVRAVKKPKMAQSTVQL